MKKILILAGRYLPGYKDGGPVRTLINLTDLLGDEYDFRIVVLDRDHGDKEPYQNIKINEWNRVGKAKVWYYEPGQMNFSLIRKLSKDVDLIYLCGFYNSYGYKTLILNRFKLLYNKPVVVASMGSFSTGALYQKHIKKVTFIKLCKMFGLFRNITWSVTSKLEMDDVQRVISNSAKCIIAEDLPRTDIDIDNDKKRNKILKIVFLSRISPIKNLDYCINVLKKIKFDVIFDIYGPLEDSEYWQRCETLLKNLSLNINWKYCGEIDTNKVSEVFSKYDLFLFPTKGENYGHVIFESLASGCIPIISDQTPWLNLTEKNVGYIIPLSNIDDYVSVINKCILMDNDEIETVFKNAVNFALQKIIDSKNDTGYRMIFEGN